MEKLKKIKLLKTLIPGIITGILIVSFLSGKVISFDKENNQSGIVSAIGVFTIILSVFVLTILVSKIKKTESN